MERIHIISPEEKKQATKCSVEGCDNKVVAKTHCRKHYMQVKRHGKITQKTIYTPNEFKIENQICKISIYDKQCNFICFAIIDKEDLEIVKKHKWCLRNNREIKNTKIGLLSRFIMNVSDPKIEIDHINHDPLDNRRSNLRPCSHADNRKNNKKYANNTSGYKGVSMDKRRDLWSAQIQFNTKNIFLGYFKCKEEAAKAYNCAAIKYFREFASLNQIG